VELWLAERPDLSALLDPSQWSPTPRASLERISRTWRLEVMEPVQVAADDAPREAQELQAGISWFVELGLEGSPTGVKTLARTARVIAEAGNGVIVEDGSVRRPGGRRRLQASGPVSEHTEVLSLRWWMYGETVSSRATVGAFVDTLDSMLQEALPVRWGRFDPPDHSLASDGKGALVEFIVEDPRIFIEGKVTNPAITFRRWNCRVLGDRQSSVGLMTGWEIELSGSLLEEPGRDAQLAQAFAALSDVLQPFYGEARLFTGVSYIREWANMRRCDNPPGVTPAVWDGFPVRPPMAMVVGPPYRDFWADLGGKQLGDLVIYIADRWPGEPAAGIPLAPPGMLQLPGRDWHARTIDYPGIWPFNDGTTASVGAAELPSPTAAENGQVTISDLAELRGLHCLLFDRKFADPIDEYFDSPYIAAVQRRVAAVLRSLEPSWDDWSDARHHEPEVERVRAYLLAAGSWWTSAPLEERRRHVLDLLSPLDVPPDLLEQLASL